MISVVIPMYNSEKTIIRALNSIKNQSALAAITEIIVVDDGSTDQSSEIVNRYCKEQELPIIILNKENGGASSARNAGLKIAKEKYIALLDADDQWLPEKISTQLDILEKNEDIILLGTTYNNQKFNRFLYKKFQDLTDITTTDLVFKNFFQPSTVVFRKEILKEIGYFPENQKYAEEGNFFMKATNLARCALLNKSYLNFGSGDHGYVENGLSGNLVEMQKGEIQNLNFAKKEKFISDNVYGIALMFSYIKYIRRIIVKKLR